MFHGTRIIYKKVDIAVIDNAVFFWGYQRQESRQLNCYDVFTWDFLSIL
jgi:hypothetical protein